MTIEKANAIIDDITWSYNGSITKEMMIECREVCHKELEKQIPKKPTFEDVGNVFGGILRTCGACGDRVVISAKAMEFENYCRRCGVKLKEEGAEE